MLRDRYLEKNKRPFFDYDTEQPPPVENFMPLSRRGGFSNIEGFEVRNLFKEFLIMKGLFLGKQTHNFIFYKNTLKFKVVVSVK